MKHYLPTSVRVFTGLLFVASAIAGMMGKVPPPEPAAAQAFMGVLYSSGLLFMVKGLELLCGLALLFGFFVPLALLVLAPIIVNIVFFHAALDPSGVLVSAVLVALWVGTAMAYPLYFKVLELAGASNLLLVTIIVPVFALSLDALLLGQLVSWSAMAGFGLVAFGLSVMDGRLYHRKDSSDSR